MLAVALICSLYDVTSAPPRVLAQSEISPPGECESNPSAAQPDDGPRLVWEYDGPTAGKARLLCVAQDVADAIGDTTGIWG
jgi:hypothetical protein